MESVAERLAQVRERIAGAAHACGRRPEDVRLIAVSKTKTASAIREAYAAGQRDFGENYVQELLTKADELADLNDLRWHVIGHLQRNKAKTAVRIASAIHTIDTVRLVQELGKRAKETPVLPAKRLWDAVDGRLPVLVEVNVGGEAQKSGCRPAELGPLLQAVEREPTLRLIGLMTVPPQGEEPPAAAVRFFEELARLRDDHGGAERLPELSMGMTEDLEPAIAAGATLVRVGRAIFGSRAPD